MITNYGDKPDQFRETFWMGFQKETFFWNKNSSAEPTNYSEARKAVKKLDASNRLKMKKKEISKWVNACQLLW